MIMSRWTQRNSITITGSIGITITIRMRMWWYILLLYYSVSEGGVINDKIMEICDVLNFVKGFENVYVKLWESVLLWTIRMFVTHLIMIIEYDIIICMDVLKFTST